MSANITGSVSGFANMVVYTGTTDIAISSVTQITSSSVAIIYTFAPDGSMLSYNPTSSFNGFSSFSPNNKVYWIVAKTNFSLTNFVPDSNASLPYDPTVPAVLRRGLNIVYWRGTTTNISSISAITAGNTAVIKQVNGDGSIGSYVPGGSNTFTQLVNGQCYLFSILQPYSLPTSIGGAVPPVPSGCVYASPRYIAAGGSTTIFWQAYDATSVTLNGQSVAAVGSKAVTPAGGPGSSTYTLVLVGAGGTTVLTETVTIMPPPVINFVANPSTTTSGGNVTLSWQISGAKSATLNSGAINLADFKVVNPTSTTTYTISATGYGGTTTAQVTVTVGTTSPPAVTFTATSPITLGGSTTLNWSVTGATSVTIEGATVAASGSVNETPTMTTGYLLTAIGAGGMTQKTVVVNVNNSGGSELLPDYVVTSWDTIPTFGADYTRKAVASGNWSATGTWSGGVVPTSSDKVYIPFGVSVIVDSTIAVAAEVFLWGKLQFSSTSSSLLTVGSLFVMEDGELDIVVTNPAITSGITFANTALNTGNVNDNFPFTSQVYTLGHNRGI